MTLRLYLRRSRADEGHQQFSLDVQRSGAERFVAADLARFDAVASWPERIEYLDDDRAGDDFLGREGLQRLLRDAAPGDVIVCRDQSRIGRDAIDVTQAIRHLLERQRARLFYYSDRREVTFRGALDAATTFIGGVGHQLELEAIRSRTREALRARVRAGHVAGGACYGYRLERQRDGAGRSFTVAHVDQEQAAVVRRVFSEYLDGAGVKLIAKRLNAARVPSPSAGRRGSGSWGPATLHAMLRNERYIGIYVHGRAIRKRQGGRKVLVGRAPASELVRVEMPDWRIIDEGTWARVQGLVNAAERHQGTRRKGGPAPRYALSGIGRCASCGGAIVVSQKRLGQATVKTYGCSYHQNRGSEVCPVTVRQPVAEVEGQLAEAVRAQVLTDAMVERLLAMVRQEIEARAEAGPVDTSSLEAELRQLRQEQRNLVRVAAAGAGAVPELAGELARRAERVEALEGEIKAAQRAPVAAAELLADAEAAVRDRMAIVLRGLAEGEPDTLRGLYRTLFPAGLRFLAQREGDRHVWLVEGVARITVVSPAGAEPMCAVERPMSATMLRCAA